jgi:tRNA threonylcarbamoyladenosine biosynthesis protein TsaB
VKLLAIETATTAGAVALVVDGTVVGQRVATSDRRHAETLVPSARAVLDDASLGLDDLDAIVVDIGPGLFTGLRVGVASARSLAFALELPIVGLTSLEILANDPLLDDEPGCLSVVDARRGELFVQRFERTQVRSEPLSEPELLAPVQLAERLKRERSNVALVGDGALRYRDLLEGLDACRLLELAIPSPGVAGQLVEHGAGQRFEDVSQLFPLYLRDPDAVANFSVAAAFNDR